MSAIVTKYEVDNSDKDSVGRDIFFSYVNNGYCINVIYRIILMIAMIQNSIGYHSMILY